MKSLHLATMLSSLLLATPVFAASSTGSTGANLDETIIKQIHLINQMDINAAQFAEKHATHKDVKTFAKQLVRDHKLGDKGTTELAKNKKVELIETSAFGAKEEAREGVREGSKEGINEEKNEGTKEAKEMKDEMKEGAEEANASVDLPGASDFREGMAKMEKLKTLSGEDFDREFVSAMAEDHQKGLELLRSETSQIKDAKVKVLTKSAIKLMEGHKKAADKLASKLGERQNTSGKTNY